jgi:ankyrin repeat protein
MSLKLTEQEIDYILSNYSDLVNYSSESVLDPIDPETYRDSDGDSLLHIAVLRGDAKTVEMLLRGGFDPNIAGEMGSTPLHYAYEPRNDEIINLLLDCGARTDIIDDLGDCPKI